MNKPRKYRKNAQVAAVGKSADLELISKWLGKRFDLESSNLDDATKRLRDVSRLKELFVKQKISEIEALLGESTKTSFVTVRSSFRENSRYLRPVHSQPEVLRDLLQNPEFQVPFKYVVNQTDHPFEGLCGLYPDERTRAPRCFVALHKLKPSTEAISNAAGKNSLGGESAGFAKRIDGFWERLENAGGRIARTAKRCNKDRTYCLFAGRNREKLRNRNELQLSHIAAIYFEVSGAIEKKLESRFSQALSIFELMYDGLELIAKIDATLFKAEGLELVTNLTREFAREEVAPADKLAYAIERLKRLLSLHMVGRHGGGKPPNIYYLSTTFERNGTGELMPRCDMYPHEYRKDFAFGAFLIAHRRVPTATKFLLMCYMQSDRHKIVETVPEFQRNNGVENSEVRLAPEFLEVFSEASLGTVPVTKWKRLVCRPEMPDMLNMMSNDEQLEFCRARDKKSPWEALNQSLEPGEQNRSIAAFVVEGRTVQSKALENRPIPEKCLPRGVFAVESEYIDAFSDKDIECLRVVFSGIASLIRRISHQHAPLDYRRKIAETFDRLVPSQVHSWKQDASLLLFLVQKLDGGQLKKLRDSLLTAAEILARHGDLGNSHANVLARLLLSPGDEEIIEEIAEIAPPKDDESLVEDTKTVLQERMEKLLDKLKAGAADKYDSVPVFEFLEACTENFAWAGYLNSMSQCMGDRVDRDLPDFTSMTPGYNATDMFMAKVAGELKQVVKFASVEDIRQERDRYRKYVRYRLVNAARISSNGFAFDTRGLDGKRSSERMRIEVSESSQNVFGVLVSDLVSAGGTADDRVLTYLDIVAARIAGREENYWPKRESIVDTSKKLFYQNDRLWFPTKDLEPLDVRNGILNAVKEVYRLPAGKGALRVKLIRAIEFYRMMAKEEPMILSYFDEYFDRDDTPMISKSDLASYSSIIHGDLNARNLTWADALDCFFLIDFENVGVGFKGADQFRLVVNTLTELYSGWRARRKNNKDPAPILRSLESGEKFLTNLFKELLEPAEQRLDQVVLEIEKSMLGEVKQVGADGLIIEVFSSILQTASTNEVNNNDTVQESEAWRNFWAYVLFCVALREFDYSCKRVKDNLMRELADECELIVLPLDKVHEKLKDCIGDRSATRDDEGFYMRNIVAARLLSRLIGVFPK